MNQNNISSILLDKDNQSRLRRLVLSTWQHAGRYGQKFGMVGAIGMVGELTINPFIIETKLELNRWI